MEAGATTLESAPLQLGLDLTLVTRAVARGRPVKAAVTVAVRATRASRANLVDSKAGGIKVAIVDSRADGIKVALVDTREAGARVAGNRVRIRTTAGTSFRAVRIRTRVFGSLAELDSLSSLGMGTSTERQRMLGWCLWQSTCCPLLLRTGAHS